MDKFSEKTLPKINGENSGFWTESETSFKEVKWHIKKSPHFIVYHESAWSPDSIVIELEKIYNIMKIDISMFSPWMMKEKGKVYIYSSRETYLNGKFDPPKWSKGLAFSKKKTIVVYDTGDIPKLKAVIAHELTHLYFEYFFGEKFKYPPQWLNEGLAVLMEDKSYGEGPWGNALKYIPKERYLKFAGFFDLELSQLQDKQSIGDWYLQSFGIIKYLFNPRKRIQFKNFCDLIRDGKNIQTALWTAYRIKNLRHFEDLWFKWVDGYGRKKKPSNFPSASFKFEPIKISSPKFKQFKTDH